MIYDGRGASSGKIVYLGCQDSPFFRVGKQDSRGKINNLYQNGEWLDNPTDYKTHTLIDPTFRPVDQVKDLKKDAFFFPLRVKGVAGNVFYETPQWNGLMESGILRLSELILEYKEKYLENGMVLKYHVEVNIDYFRSKYPEWDALDMTKSKKEGEENKMKRQEIMKKELGDFEAKMSSQSNSGKTLLTLKLNNKATGNDYSTWTIHPIKNETQSGEYTEDFNQTSLIKLRAIGLDPALVGNIATSKGNMGAGSGSAGRTAFHVNNILSLPWQNKVLEPLNRVIRHVNGWSNPTDPSNDIRFFTKAHYLALQSEVNPEDRQPNTQE
jgi:hypothetical protein